MMRCGPLWSMVIVGGLLGERRLARLRHLLPRRGDSRLARLDGAIAGHIMSSERLGPVAVARSIGPHPTASGCTSSTLRACGGGPLGIKRVSEVVPGIGRSERKPERSVIDWPSDVAELATALRLERFAVAGHSAGGAYVLACAERLRDAVSEAAVFAPVPRVDRPGGLDELATARYWELARRRPGVLRAVYRLLGGGLRTAPRLAARRFLRESAQADRDALSAEDALRRFRASVLEGMRLGPRGFVEDMRALLRPWGLDESRIGAGVRLWHGEADAHVAPASTSRYAERITGAKVIFVEGRRPLLTYRATGH